MHDQIEIRCAGIFRSAAGLDNMPEYATLEDRHLVVAPLHHFEMDSLSGMEFIMEVENAFGVELDEEAVNRCNTVAEVASLVSVALRG